MRLSRTLACAALCLAAATHTSSAEDLDEDFQVWTPVVLQLDIKPKVLRAWLEVQPRFFDDASRVGMVLWRPALAFYVTDWLTVWGGYAFVETFTPSYSAENRIWEQVQVARDLIPTPKLNMVARLRLEQRFQEGQDPVAHVLRFLLRGSIPLGDPDPPSFYAVVWNEVFVNLNSTDWVGTSGLNQNRAFAGLGFMPMRQLRLELGYMAQYVYKRDADDLLNHTLFAALWVELP